MKKLIILFLLFIATLNTYAQVDPKITPADSIINESTKSWGILIGGGFNHSGVGEIGFGGAEFRPLKYLNGKVSQFLPQEYMVGQVYLSNEFIFRPNRLMIAPKIGVNFSISFVNFSYCNFLYYTDFKEGALSYRPELGFSLWGGRLFYAYNIPISNKSFLKDYRHQVGLTWFFKTGKSRKILNVMNRETKKVRLICE